MSPKRVNNFGLGHHWSWSSVQDSQSGCLLPDTHMISWDVNPGQGQHLTPWTTTSAKVLAFSSPAGVGSQWMRNHKIESFWCFGTLPVCFLGRWVKCGQVHILHGSNCVICRHHKVLNLHLYVKVKASTHLGQFWDIHHHVQCDYAYSSHSWVLPRHTFCCTASYIGCGILLSGSLRAFLP